MNELYNEILKALCVYKSALCDAMVLCQSWGYNGHKRKYRWYERHFNNYCLEIKNEMFDEHNIIANTGHVEIPAYKPRDIKEHSIEWLKIVAGTLTIVIKAHNALLIAAGKRSCAVEKVIDCLYKEQEKARRFIVRGEDIQWMTHDLHRQDDVLHEKIKKKEKKDGH